MGIPYITSHPTPVFDLNYIQFIVIFFSPLGTIVYILYIYIINL